MMKTASTLYATALFVHQINKNAIVLRHYTTLQQGPIRPQGGGKRGWTDL